MYIYQKQKNNNYYYKKNKIKKTNYYALAYQLRSLIIVGRDLKQPVRGEGISNRAHSEDKVCTSWLMVVWVLVWVYDPFLHMFPNVRLHNLPTKNFCFQSNLIELWITWFRRINLTLFVFPSIIQWNYSSIRTCMTKSIWYGCSCNRWVKAFEVTSPTQILNGLWRSLKSLTCNFSLPSCYVYILVCLTVFLHLLLSIWVGLIEAAFLHLLLFMWVGIMEACLFCWDEWTSEVCVTIFYVSGC